MSLFKDRPRLDLDHAASIKAWVRARWGLSEDTTIMVTELDCREPGCPPIETIIVVLEGPGRTKRYKIHKAAAEVTGQDVEELTDESHADRH